MQKLSEEKIEEVRSATNLVHYINQYVNLKKAGKNFKGLCPFHTEKTPSFIVSPEKQIYHCFGCGKGGNIFSFIMENEKVTFIESVRRAAQFSGVQLPEPSQESKQKSDFFQQFYEINEITTQFFEENVYKPANKKYLDYFINRGLSPGTIKQFRLGYAPDTFDRMLQHLESNKVNMDSAAQLGLIQKRENGSGFYDKFRHRIMFPFQNISGKIVGFGGRKLRDEQQPKYLNSPESPVYRKGELLYGLHQAISAIRKNDFVILVEGYFDLLRLVEAGYSNVVASSGTALTPEQAKLINRYTRNVYVAYDGDEAGINAAIRISYILENNNLNTFIIAMPQNEDPDTIIQKYGREKFEELIERRMPLIDFHIASFYQEQEAPTSRQKEQFVEEILTLMAENRNQVRAGLTIHQLSDRLQINESLLIERYNRLKRRRKSSTQPDDRSPSPVKSVGINLGAYKAETGIISLLLGNQTDIRRFIIDHISAQMFENEELRRLFEYIINGIEETGDIEVNSLISDQDSDPALKGILSEMALQEIADADKYARDCVFQLKKWHLENKAREISRHIRAEAGSMESVMHYTQELTRVRKEISELDRQLRKHSDNQV